MTFQYSNNTHIVFGREAVASLKDVLQQRGATSVLLVSSGDYVDDLGIRDRVKNAAEAVGARFSENRNVVSNPRIDLVRTLIGQSRHDGVDLIIGAGGASSFDTAKAVAVGVPYDGDVWDLFTGTRFERRLAVGVIATLAGSGSEVSDCAVIQEGTDKRALEDYRLTPDFALVNPEYSATVPYRYQAAAAADLAYSFLEPYFASEVEIESADRLLEGGFLAALRAGRYYAEHPESYSVRAELHWLSAAAFNHCYLATGRANDWTTHRLEHALGGEFDIVHGEGIAALGPSIIRYVARRKPERYARLAVRALGVDPYDVPAEGAALILADRLEEHFRALRLPTGLGQLGIPKDSYEHVADGLTGDGTSTVGNYSPLNRQDVLEILRQAS